MILRKEIWSAQAEQILKPALCGDERIIADEVARGVSELYSANGGHLFVVLRAEGDELVIVAVAGKGLLEFGRWIFQRARDQGYESIRYHTQRPALHRLLREFAPRPLEYVARIDL
jgi:hypothetical protein